MAAKGEKGKGHSHIMSPNFLGFLYPPSLSLSRSCNLLVLTSVFWPTPPQDGRQLCKCPPKMGGETGEFAEASNRVGEHRQMGEVNLGGKRAPSHYDACTTKVSIGFLGHYGV